MKTKIISIVMMLLMACNVMAQDYMTVYFKNGTDRKFYLKDIASIATKKLDAEGIQHGDYEFQHITTYHNKYVYNLNEVDSITFSSIDEEAAERNFVAAMPEVITAISDCNTIDDAEKLVDQIKAMNGIGDAWTDGHVLNVLIEEGETYSFYFEHDYNLIVDTTLVIPMRARAMAPKQRSKAELENFTPSVAMIFQHPKDDSRYYQLDKFLYIEKFLLSCGIDVHIITNPTVDFFYDNSHVYGKKNIYDYDYIVLHTHGAYGYIKYYDNGKIVYGPKSHTFLTSEELFTTNSKNSVAQDSPDWLSNYNIFYNWRNNSEYYDATDKYINYGFSKELRGDQWKWIAYPVLTEFFFKDYAQGLFKNNSLLFSSSCESMKGDNDAEALSMANIFLEDRNLGSFMGYTEEVANGYYAASILLNAMIVGYSFERACNVIPVWATDETLENWLAAGFSDFDGPYNAHLRTTSKNEERLLGSFILPALTFDVNVSNANQEWIETGKVTVSGAQSISNLASGLSAGFEYGLDPNNLDKSVSSNMITGAWNGKSYFSFDGILSELEAGKTYYYRAYTFDGTHFNYGKTKDFLLKSGKIITLSQNELVLHSGNSGVVPIEEGSGDYSCTVNWGDIVSAEIIGNEVIVKSLVPGEAIVTVTDNGLGQATKLKVSVIYADERCPDEHHPHMIDLGLPSGTLWSCSNVWTLSPEGYGNYYAWGETDEKRDCVKDNYYYRNPEADCYSYLGTDIARTSYDAAHMLWGDLWQMPSKEQFQELINNCTWEHLTQNGVEGYLATSRNGASVFLPFAGCRTGESRDHEGEYGGYWTSSWFSNETMEYAWLFSLQPNYEPKIYEAERYKGWSVRPVCTGLPSTVLRVDRNDVELNVGDRTSISITSGSGNYRIHNSKEIALWASLENGTIALEGLKGGNAVVTLTDITTKQTTEITVRVLGDEEPIQTETFTVNGVSFTMVTVEGGTFMMGASESDQEASESEKPQHQVTLSSYSIGQTEVTQELWEAVMGDNPSYYTGSANLPVEQVSWYDCQRFISNLNKLTGKTFSLPTDAEWEYAARGGNKSKDYKYSGSDNVNDVAWYNDNSGNTPHVVGTKSANELGIYDMSGNVWEWCQDYYGEYSSEAQVSPTGPTSGTRHILRGGSWNFSSSFCRSCHRNWDTTDHLASHLGLRLALSTNGGGNLYQSICPDDNHPHMIDLGLPSGTKWACCNIGGAYPDEYGGYYAWLEVEEKESYSWSTYTHCDGTEDTCHDIYDIIIGPHNVAQEKWGGLWDLPSKSSYEELKRYCTRKWTDLYGTKGALFIGPNGNRIFMPAGGYRENSYRYNLGKQGDFWTGSGSIFSDNSFIGYEFNINDIGSAVIGEYPYIGLNVRAIVKP